MIGAQAGIALSVVLFGAAGMAAVADHGADFGAWLRRKARSVGRVVAAVEARSERARARRYLRPLCGVTLGCPHLADAWVLTERGDTAPACRRCVAARPGLHVLYMPAYGGDRS